MIKPRTQNVKTVLQNTYVQEDVHQEISMQVGDFEKIDDMQCIPTKVILRKYIIDLYEQSI